MGFEIGEQHRCPECGSLRGKIIWKSRDGETIGIKCPRSGYSHKKNSVILVHLDKENIDQKNKILKTLSVVT